MGRLYRGDVGEWDSLTDGVSCDQVGAKMGKSTRPVNWGRAVKTGRK